MRTKQYTTTLPADIAERVDEYKDERDLNKSTAIERLVHAQIRAMDEDDEDNVEPAPRLVTLYQMLLVAGIATLPLGVTGYFALSTSIAPDLAWLTVFFATSLTCLFMALAAMAMHRRQLEDASTIGQFADYRPGGGR